MLAKVAAAVCHGKGVCFVCRRGRYLINFLTNSVAELFNFYAAPALVINFDAASVLTLLRVNAIFSSDFLLFKL
jgi:hypothetical protein